MCCIVLYTLFWADLFVLLFYLCRNPKKLHWLLPTTLHCGQSKVWTATKRCFFLFVSCVWVEMWSLKFARKSSSRSCSVQMVNCISNRVATFLSLLIRMQELGWIAWSLTLVASREAREWWFIILVYLLACVVVFMFSFYCFSTTRTLFFRNFSLICGWDFVSVYSQTVQGTKWCTDQEAKGKLLCFIMLVLVFSFFLFRSELGMLLGI